MPTEVKAFKCDFCKKHYLHKSNAAAHEKKCFYNPASKSCLTCGNFIKHRETVYVPPHGDQNYGDEDYDVTHHECAYTRKSFESDNDRQRFQRKCPHWIAPRCSRDCDYCDICCVFD